MNTHGFLAPESESTARDRYEAVGPTAQTVVKETAKAMAFDADEYDDWLTNHDREVVEQGSENVDRVAWHDALGETVVAATYQSEERAAVATLRRQAFGQVYRELF